MNLKDLIFTNISECLSLGPAAQKGARRIDERDLGVINNAILAVRDGRIVWVGPKRKLTSQLKRQLFSNRRLREVDLGGATVLPGFIECHTHLLFAGDRRDEFEARNQGASYQEISAKGGGILSTMRATRSASQAELVRLGQGRINRFVAQGVTTIEVKSGYGLEKQAEIKILEAAQRLKGAVVVPTFLGPHSMPPEFKSSDDYLTYLIDQVLPEVARRGLAKRLDIYVEKGFFSLDQAERWSRAAGKYGLSLVGHVDQLTAGGGARRLIQLGALSVDHAVHLAPEEIKMLAASSTTAVLLPTSDFYLRVTYPPARAMLDAGARVALATDFNPGTSPTQDLSLVGVLARIEMKMTLAEVISAYTIGAAHALGMESEVGSLSVGKWADFVVLEGSWRDLFYQVGYHPVRSVWSRSRNLWKSTKKSFAFR